MMKKLIVIAMLIATLGIGIDSIIYAQATGGSPGKQLGTGRKGRHRTHSGRHHRRHKRGGFGGHRR